MKKRGDLLIGIAGLMTLAGGMAPAQRPAEQARMTSQSQTLPERRSREERMPTERAGTQKKPVLTLDRAIEPMRQRIGKDVDVLKKESVRDSLTMLSEVEMFFWPGGERDGHIVLAIPLMKENGMHAGEAVFSNRRFLKLYHELSLMPQGEASALINAEFKTCLVEYKRQFEATWAQVLEMRKKHPVEGKDGYAVGPSLILSNNRDHSPTLVGLRYKIFAMLMLSGNLGLTDTRETVRDVADEALRQRKYFYDEKSGGTMPDRVSMLTSTGIYNRQVLATAFLGVNRSKEWNNEKAWRTYQLTMYDAAFTPFDLLTRYGGPIPSDYSKGTQQAKVHIPIDDSEFDALMGW